MAQVGVKCTFCECTGCQRYRCQSCCRTFQLEYAYRACQPGMKEQIVDLATNNAGIRDTARA